MLLRLICRNCFEGRRETKMKGVGCKGSLHRIKNCAADLLSMEDELVDDEGSWELIGRDLRLKSVFLYCDLNRVISSYSDDSKKNLTYLANRLFEYMEELDSAVKSRTFSLIQIRYSEAAMALRELITALFSLTID